MHPNAIGKRCGPFFFFFLCFELPISLDIICVAFVRKETGLLNEATEKRFKLAVRRRIWFKEQTSLARVIPRP
jgi:hypothetical protein